MVTKVMDTDDSEDQVVKEIPVHMCRELHKKLYLFQFPCRPADANYNTKNIVSSRVKPQSGIIELDCALNTEDKFYDKRVGEELARGNDTKQNSENSSQQLSSNKQRNRDETQLLDKVTLQSQRSILQKDIACYSVVSLCEGKFCISSLHDSVSFLPNYDHVEKSKKLKANAKNISSADAVSSSEDEDDTTAVQVTVKFSPRHLDKSKISQELNHQQYLTKIAEEPWYQTTYHQRDSSLALAKLESISKSSAEDASKLLSLSENEYLNLLIPPETAKRMN